VELQNAASGEVVEATATVLLKIAPRRRSMRRGRDQNIKVLEGKGDEGGRIVKLLRMRQ
jgi:hypothetical protein